MKMNLASELRQIVDQHGLHETLELLRDICRDKSLDAKELGDSDHAAMWEEAQGGLVHLLRTNIPSDC